MCGLFMLLVEIGSKGRPVSLGKSQGQSMGSGKFPVVDGNLNRINPGKGIPAEVDIKQLIAGLEKVQARGP